MNSENLSTNVIPETDKTPIEVALKIDENGMTTASNLYSFLELHPAHFSRWCKKNIKNNKFASEGRDYIVFTIKGEKYVFSNGRPKTDYKLTADFAKKLSLTGNPHRHEEARKYFIACEQCLKATMQKTNSDNKVDLQPLLDVINIMSENINIMQQNIQELKEYQSNRYLNSNRYPSTWFKRMNQKYKMLEKYFGCSRRELYSNIYKEIEDTYDVDINQIHEEYCYENNLLKSECYPMDAIEHNNYLKEAVTLLIDNALLRYGLQTEEQIKCCKRETLFDREPIDAKIII